MKESVSVELVGVVMKVVLGGVYVSFVMVEQFVQSLNELVEMLLYQWLFDCEFDVFWWIVVGQMLIEIVNVLCVSVKMVSIYKIWILEKMQMLYEVVFVCYVMWYKLFDEMDDV